MEGSGCVFSRAWAVGMQVQYQSSTAQSHLQASKSASNSRRGRRRGRHVPAPTRLLRMAHSPACRPCRQRRRQTECQQPPLRSVPTGRQQGSRNGRAPLPQRRRLPNLPPLAACGDAHRGWVGGCWEHGGWVAWRDRGLAKLSTAEHCSPKQCCLPSPHQCCVCQERGGSWSMCHARLTAATQARMVAR